MLKTIILTLGLTVCVGNVHAATDGSETSKNRLWYNRPASYWEEALPLGNGRLGAMVSGSVAQDTIQLNEDTFWGQSPNNNYNPDAKQALQKIRNYIFNKDYAEGEQLAIKALNSKASHGAKYQSAGCVLISFPGHRFNTLDPASTSKAKDVTNYYRDLNLETAVSTTRYTVKGVTYTRTTITSFKDNVILMHLEVSKPKSLNFSVCYAAPEKNSLAKLGEYSITKDDMIKTSLIPGTETTEGVDNKMQCYTFIKVMQEGGKQKTNTTTNVQKRGIADGNDHAPTIEITGANSATIIISSATNFVNYSDISANAEAKALGYLTEYLNKKEAFEESLKAHIDRYSQEFSRVSLSLGENKELESKPTDERIAAFHENAEDMSLIATYFQFGRYLLICSSQPGTQPANLQGIWNPNARQYPAWDSKYTSNINVEMNYWPAEVTNLAECHLPLIEMVRDLSVTGKEAAKEMYGARGWVLHHNTDIWRTTGAVDNNSAGIWPTCNAWLCSHLWERYLFSGDKNYLRSVYPILKGCSQFYQDFLVRDPNTGYMVVCPSNSPENNPGVASYIGKNERKQQVAVFGGIAMDNQMVYDVLKNTAEAARILQTDALFANELDTLKSQITPYKIGKYGQVQEWQEDWDREFSGHRHLSHLWGAFPGNQVSPYVNPTLFQAVYKSLVGRGDAARGWSMGWKVCLWARMLDGNHTLDIIKNQMRLVSPNITIRDPNGGTYANMFDAHAPFQIDGNFGCCAGIAEMLVQSHAGFIHLLPAIPQKWSEGCVKGLRARGGFEIKELCWQNGQLKKVVILSTIGGNLRLRSNSALIHKDGTAVTPASGDNTNPLTQPYNIPEPIVADSSKIAKTVLPQTYLYDIPTTIGETITLVAK